MERKAVLTADGSHTIALSGSHITYHSLHGAVQESRHVYIEAGLKYALSQFTPTGTQPLRVMEIGFGTGLNALLSYQQMREIQSSLYYYAIEPYPLLLQEAQLLNYVQQLADPTLAPVFSLLHTAVWEEAVGITNTFTLYKTQLPVLQMAAQDPFHVVYFDAFAPDVQPELWTTEVFEKLYQLLYGGGALVTYCSKGTVRRAMQSVGFIIEKRKGPPGKREMVRAIKTR